MLKEIEFILSTKHRKDYPRIIDSHGNVLPEIAFVGRSNVGKSSLLNHLTHQKNLARISSTPGKTQMINFFRYKELFALVDLPGYGFAKTSRVKQDQWKEMVEEYLVKRETLSLILHLCDARHPPSKLDLTFAKWAAYFNKPLMIVFTKTDKLSDTVVQRQCEKNFSIFSEEIQFKDVSYLPYSIKNPNMRNSLLHNIKKRLKWAQ